MSGVLMQSAFLCWY